jgi:hypothetical protein
MALCARLRSCLVGLTLLLLVLAFSQAGTTSISAGFPARTFMITTSGSDSSACGAQNSPCRTIQYGVNLAANGDFILVAAGTYTYGSSTDICTSNLGSTAVICVVNKQLNILGGYSAQNWNNPDPANNLTVIDGAGSRRGVWVTSTGPAAALRLEGFTIRNGVARGIALRSGDDHNSGFGGGAFAENAFITLRNLVFENNQALGDNTGNNYGGAGAGGGLAIRVASDGSSLENLVFRNNLARGGTGPERGGFGVGGGLFTYSSTINNVHDLVFSGNSAMGGSTNGGGIDSIVNQLGDGQGGGAAFQLNSTVHAVRITASGNTAAGGAAVNGNSGAGFGGGVFAEEASLTLEDSNFTNNTALGGTGVNSAAGTCGSGMGQGGGIETFNSDFTLNRVSVINNTAQGGAGASYKGSAGGGGIAIVRLSGNSSSQLTNVVIADNLAAMGGGSDSSVGGGGGGLWLQGTNTTIVQATLARNRINSGNMQGQAAVILNFGAATAANVNLDYSIVSDHANNWGVVALHVQPGNTLTLLRGLWAGNNYNTNAGGNGGPPGTINGQASMLSASTAGFTSPGAPQEDYQLTPSSAAIDQAVGSSVPVDINGYARQNPPDVGAYELQAALANHLYLPLIIR